MKEQLIELANYFNKEILELFNIVSNKGECADAFADFHDVILEKIDKMIDCYEDKTNEKLLKWLFMQTL